MEARIPKGRFRVVKKSSNAKKYASAFARKGGQARARKLTANERSAAARRAVRARWAKARAQVQTLTATEKKGGR